MISLARQRGKNPLVCHIHPWHCSSPQGYSMASKKLEIQFWLLCHQPMDKNMIYNAGSNLVRNYHSSLSFTSSSSSLPPTFGLSVLLGSDWHPLASCNPQKPGCSSNWLVLVVSAHLTWSKVNFDPLCLVYGICALFVMKRWDVCSPFCIACI